MESIDTLILGLLSLKSLTIYEIRSKVKNGMYMICSDSMGSIQAAVKKLLKNGCIIYNEKVESGKFKKVYTITGAGQEYSKSWVNMPIRAWQSKNNDLAKLFFGGLSESDTRIERIKQYICELQEQYDVLKTLYENTQTL